MSTRPPSFPMRKIPLAIYYSIHACQWPVVYCDSCSRLLRLADIRIHRITDCRWPRAIRRAAAALTAAERAPRLSPPCGDGRARRGARGARARRTGMRYGREVLGVVVLVVVLGFQAAGIPAAPTAQSAVLEAASGAALGTAPGAALAEPLPQMVPVRVGLLASISDSGVYIGLERGYYRDQGIELSVETVPDPNTIVTLTSTNQLDVGGSGVTANPFQAAARGIPVKMVADKGQQRPGFGYYPLIVRQALYDSGQMRDFADLRGRAVGKLSRGDSQDPQLERALARGGLTHDDVDLRYMSFPDMNAALANGALDA